ncbi:hypothetical protein [Pseudalkalibacillus caeni]|uniref:Uncharacterized protein n=1 Tax=Exobacillus caeni TaxID=2574798 RepID=A0A5R9F3C8_9BACL|nr:hypothetical protein [Pseudalkalibacillus caeni]TLS38192.1 hypothetical protein FCL54_06550 [Pseudalkalibacillus caeni]
MRRPFLTKTRILVIYGILVTFSIKYPNDQVILAEMMERAGVPAWSENGEGIHYAGIILFFLLIFTLYFINHFFGVKAALLAFFAPIFLTGLILISFQAAFANGIYAVAYNNGSSSCIYDTENNILTGSCSFSITNYSDEEIQFTAQLHNGYQDEIYSLVMEAFSSKNLGIKPHETREYTVPLKYRIPKDSSFRQIKGRLNGIPLLLREGVYERRL